jgi:hypothetical protein
MPEHRHRELGTQVGKQAQQRGYLRFGWGYAIQITHKGYAHRICVVPATVCAHSLKGARGMHAAVGHNHEVVRDVGVAPPNGAGSELLQRRVYGGVMDDDLSDGSHGESPVTDQ